MADEPVSLQTDLTELTSIPKDAIVYIEKQDLTFGYAKFSSLGIRDRIVLNMQSTSIANGTSVVMKRWTAGAGESLRVNRGGVTDDSGSVPAGLVVRLHNTTDSTDTTLIDADEETGDPIITVDIAGDDVQIEVYNGTGGTLTAQADINCEVV